MEIPVWRRHMTRSGLCLDMVDKKKSRAIEVGERSSW